MYSSSVDSQTGHLFDGGSDCGDDAAGSPFKTQYERTSQMAQDIVLGRMYVLTIYIPSCTLHLNGFRRDLQLAQALTGCGIDNIFTFR